MVERHFDVTYNSGTRRNEVVESFTDAAGRDVEIVRGWFPFHADADAELFCAVLRAVGGATVGWAEVIRENGLALGDRAKAANTPHVHPAGRWLQDLKVDGKGRR